MVVLKEEKFVMLRGWLVSLAADDKLTSELFGNPLQALYDTRPRLFLPAHYSRYLNRVV